MLDLCSESAPSYSINKHLLKYQEEAEVSSLPSRVSQPSGDAHSPGDNVCVPMCVYKVRGSLGQRVTTILGLNIFLCGFGVGLAKTELSTNKV